MKRTFDKWSILTIVGLLVWAVFVFKTAPARAHDIYHDWKIPGTTTSCCNDQDCGPTRARVHVDGNYWEVWHNGEWLAVPPYAVLDMKSPDGRSHACVIGRTPVCFVPGEIRG